MTGGYLYTVLFLTLATVGTGLYADAARITILSLAAGILMAVVAAGVRVVYYGSVDLLVTVLLVFAATLAWKLKVVTQTE